MRKTLVFSHTIFLGFFFLISSISNAQLNPYWVNHVGSTSFDGITNFTVDDNKNEYILGTFTGTVNLGAGLVSSSPSTVSDAFFAKYDSLGNYVWAKLIKGSYQKEQLKLNWIILETSI